MTWTMGRKQKEQEAEGMLPDSKSFQYNDKEQGITPMIDLSCPQKPS